MQNLHSQQMFKPAATGTTGKKDSAKKVKTDKRKKKKGTGQ